MRIKNNKKYKRNKMSRKFCKLKGKTLKLKDNNKNTLQLNFKFFSWI